MWEYLQDHGCGSKVVEGKKEAAFSAKNCLTRMSKDENISYYLWAVATCLFYHVGGDGGIEELEVESETLNCG